MSSHRLASLIIPAHNEGEVIGRLLRLLAQPAPIDLETIVVPNGCTDDTAAIARSFEGVKVVEIPQASKHAALLAGDRSATQFPRFYVDADIEINRADILHLVDALDEPDVLAVGPARTMQLEYSPWTVRAYHRVWEQLPAVHGLQGRGVIGVSEAGHGRLAGRPEVIADDLFVNSRFTADQKRIVRSARVEVHAPRTLKALVRRRTRAVSGNTQMRTESHGATSTTSSSLAHVVGGNLRRPRQWADVLVFVTVTVAARASARLNARREAIWLRDETSRAA